MRASDLCRNAVTFKIYPHLAMYVESSRNMESLGSLCQRGAEVDRCSRHNLTILEET